MIFAELRYDGSYDDAHAPLAALLGAHFRHVESGLQGDSWIWIVESGRKVSVDTFTSMHHQIKSHRRCALVDEVLGVLAGRYELHRLDPPELEGHEELDDAHA